jgi:lipoate-protein ligase A
MSSARREQDAMAETWRLLDTGLASAARNIAMSRALLEARRRQEIGSTLRFLRYTRTALLGYFQSAQQELDVAHCRERGVVVQRRITGGRTMYADEAQLGWELYLHRDDLGTDGQRIVRRVCHAAATALSALGVDARYRQRDEIEIDGCTVCLAGCAVDGDAMLLQAVLWLDIDAAELERAFRRPAMASTGTGGPRRAVGLKAALGRVPSVHRIRENLVEAFESDFGVEFSEGEPGLSEQHRFDEALRAIDTPQWMELFARPAADKPISEAVHQTRGAVVRVAAATEAATSTLREVWFSGDFTVNPARTLRDLEAALRDVPITRAPEKIRWFFASRPADLGGLTADDFITALRLALKADALFRTHPYW